MKTNVMPSFGDDDLKFYPPVLLQYLKSNYLNAPFTVSTDYLNSWSYVDWGFGRACLVQILAWFPSIKTPTLPDISTTGTDALRKYYNATGILISRPDAVSNGAGLALTAKTLGNGGHSHIDCGSYVIALNGIILTGEPGGWLSDKYI